MAWAKSIAIGLGLGALISVIPLDCVGFALAPFVAFGLLRWRSEARRLTLTAVIAGSVGAVASQLPFKFLDRELTRPLPANCTSLEVVASAAQISSQGVSESVLNREVCFSSLRPSLREVERAANESGAALQVGWCGTGATLLWGMHPIRMSLSPLISR